MANLSVPGMGKFFIGVLALLMVSGCAGKFRSDVSSWHRLQQPSGETFVVTAKDPMKAGSLEFAAYAGMMAEELRKLGYRPVERGGKPDLIVRVDYGVSDGRTEVRSYNYGGYGGWGPYGWGHYGHYSRFGYWGSPYGPGYSDIRSYPVYNRKLEMEIAAAGNPNANIFESRVMSEGRSNRLEEVMPLLVESMFQEFPGPSGVTRRVTIDLENSTRSY